MVGPVCSGKTQILKITSKVFEMAFGITLRTSVINSAILSQQELYGATKAFQKQTKVLNEQDKEGKNSFG